MLIVSRVLDGGLLHAGDLLLVLDFGSRMKRRTEQSRRTDKSNVFLHVEAQTLGEAKIIF